MRNTIAPELMRGRVRKGPMASPDRWGLTGAFFVAGPHANVLKIVASDGRAGTPDDGWEHVSVSCQRRCPNWPEMAFVKLLFWSDNETVVQFHPKKTEYVNCHPYCLHLWKRVGEEYELPPSSLVGPKQ